MNSHLHFDKIGLEKINFISSKICVIATEIPIICVA